ncbi:MAG: maleylacetate reductase [Proteobacteria bacterium]|nr:maleylacetate reductase [Pseudomonadota bacterium]
MQSFVYHPSSQRILFGTGEFQKLAEETDRLSIERALVITSPGRSHLADRAAALLGPRCTGCSTAATANIPRHAVVDAQANLAAANADGMIVIGGGSAIGLGKALAAEMNLPSIAVVATYSGSEMAASWTIDDAQGRQQGRDPAALPKTAIYDPLLTVDLPPRFSAASGMNAMAHAVESLYGENANPIADVMAGKAIQLLASSLPFIVRQPSDLEARGKALYGAWLAANFRGGTGIEHRIAQTLRYQFDLSHAEAHAAVLPYAVAFNQHATPGAMARICRAMDSEDGPTGIYNLNVALGLKTGLREFGLTSPDLERGTDLLPGTKFFNPRPAGRDDIRTLIQEMYEGEPPVSL